MEITEALEKEIIKLIQITDKIVKNRFESAKIEDEGVDAFYEEYLITKGRVQAMIYILKQQNQEK